MVVLDAISDLLLPSMIPSDVDGAGYVAVSVITDAFPAMMREAGSEDCPSDSELDLWCLRKTTSISSVTQPSAVFPTQVHSAPELVRVANWPG